jgi:tellurite resistance protein TerC
MPISNHIDHEKFFVKAPHYCCNPTICCIGSEVMDVVFAIDSVPAILAITSDPFSIEL